MRQGFLLTFMMVVSLAFGQAKVHRVVIEVNVPGTTAYGLILNNVENLAKAFAPEKVEVEIVCHGPGLDMLLSSNGMSKRMGKLRVAGVQFAACMNSIRGRHIDKRHLYPFVQYVPSGVAEVVRKQEAGWSYLKGAY